MSNGDDEPADAADAEADDGADEQEAPDPEEVAAEFEERLDEAESALDEAESETERDEVESTLDAIESDLADAEFPAPEAGDGAEEDADEEVPDYEADIEARIESLRESLAAARPPAVVADFRRRLETVETELEEAESQSDYDEIETELDDVASALAEADVPGPEDEEADDAADEADDESEAAEADDEAEDEDAEAETPDYRADLEARLAAARAAVVIGRYRLRIEAVEEDVAEAETEVDLDDLDERLDEIEADLEAADLPEPEADDAPQPRDEIESMLSDARDAVEEERGPYGEDVVADTESAREQIESSEWTEQEGLSEVAETVDAFLEAFDEIMDVDVAAASDDLDDLDAALAETVEAVEAADLHADHDAETIAALLDATDGLLTGLDESTTWSDLTVRTQLTRQGFYDRLTAENRRDFPPELNVVRVAERENDPERILMALGYLESNFMEDNVLDALRRLAPAEAYEPMMERAEKRDQDAIRVLGKIGDDRAVDTLLGYIEGEGNPPLQKVTLRALGEIGSHDATEGVAQRLVADDAEVRSHAARALGLLGDTRAISPLGDALADDADDSVRAAAGWALNQIGTETALETAAEYADDRSYIVQAEAEKAADALAASASGSDSDDDGGADSESEDGAAA
ncbi:MAG: HEAT repeat domain-containing protein [Haloarculaceae archaeon]